MLPTVLSVFSSRVGNWCRPVSYREIVRLFSEQIGYDKIEEFEAGSVGAL